MKPASSTASAVSVRVFAMSSVITGPCAGRRAVVFSFASLRSDSAVG
jgi:hypothetical protein